MTAETTTGRPVEGRCEGCKQVRPLFPYVPDHGGMHIQPALVTGCRWCTREKQPELCVRCWGKEREREDNDPQLAEEDETWSLLLAGNARAEARRQADRETVAGIAAVSGIGGAS